MSQRFVHKNSAMPKGQAGFQTKPKWTLDVSGEWILRRAIDSSLQFDRGSSPGGRASAPPLFMAPGLLLPSRGQRQVVAFAGLNCQVQVHDHNAAANHDVMVSGGSRAAVATCRADVHNVPVGHRMWDVDARFGQCLCSNGGSVPTTDAIEHDVTAYLRVAVGGAGAAKLGTSLHV